MVRARARVSQEQGKWDQAKTLFERALDINEKKRGPDHRETINARGNLACVAMLRGGGRCSAEHSAERSSAEHEEGRAAVEEALRQLKAPPHSLLDTHPWVRKFVAALV